MGNHRLFPLLHMDDLVDLPLGKENDFSGKVADGVVLHLVNEISQYPNGGKQSPIHLFGTIRRGAVAAIYKPDTSLLGQMGQQIFYFIPFSRVQPEQLLLLQNTIHGNVPEQADSLMAV